MVGRLLHDLADFLARVFSVGSPSLGSALELIVVAGLVVGAAALAARLVPRRRPPGLAGASASLAVAGYDAARLSALELADRDPREALRILYGAALGELGRRRGWRARPGRTNWGFVRALGAETPEAAALAECTRLFERGVYGDAAVAPDDVRHADDLARSILR